MYFFSAEARKESTICPIPWRHIYIQNSSRQSLCCYARPTADIPSERLRTMDKVHAFGDLANSLLLRFTRKMMLEGRKPKACDYCYAKEEAGFESPRLNYIREYNWKTEEEKFLSFYIEDHEIESLDLRLGNSCNFSCRMCSPSSSSRVAKVFSAMKPVAHNKDSFPNWGDFRWADSERNWNLLFNSGVSFRRIHFAGGEPLISSNHREFMARLIKSGKCKNASITYNTNLSVLPSRLDTYAKHFRELRFFVSVDGVGETLEYIRVGSSWNLILQNLIALGKLAEDYENVSIEMTTTLQADNALSITDLFSELERLHDCYPKIPLLPNFNILSRPQILSGSVLPKEKRTIAISRIERFLELFGEQNKYASSVSQLREFCMLLGTPETKETEKLFFEFSREFDRHVGLDSPK